VAPVAIEVGSERINHGLRGYRGCETAPKHSVVSPPVLDLVASSASSVSSAVKFGHVWICCQLGAREHYSIPRALLAAGIPCHLVTDAWVQNGNPLGKLKRNLRERYHADLVTTPVDTWNLHSIAFELRAKIVGLHSWPLIIARNKWFQRMAVRKLSAMEVGRWKMGDNSEEMGDRRSEMRTRSAEARSSNSYLQSSTPVLFAYSYAAIEIFRWAKQQGWRTVLGQIDPGPPEERIVARLHEETRWKMGDGRWEPAPPEYWADWREECQLADRIVVNSAWSQRALIEEGIPTEKIRIVPLAYENKGPRDYGTTGQQDSGQWSVVSGQIAERQYPERFTAERPLRVLFLGQINLRKGVGPLMDAARLLRDEPIEFWMVGPIQIDVPADVRSSAKFRWTGPVPRSTAADFYRDADVFLFPTFSDGFGLTQLEAQSWKMPVIASKFCGEVVEDGRNGRVLEEVSAKAIAGALQGCLAEPACLGEFARNAVPSEQFGLKQIGEQLLGVFD
jgi:glycosyltransferase involved in cell wall biosynthesis